MEGTSNIGMESATFSSSDLAEVGNTKSPEQKLDDMLTGDYADAYSQAFRGQYIGNDRRDNSYTLREFVRLDRDKARMLAEVYKNENGSPNTSLERALQQVEYLDNNLPSTINEPGLEDDEKYLQIKEELNRRHVQDVFGTLNMQDLSHEQFMQLANSDTNLRFNLEDLAKREFRHQHPQKETEYMQKERLKIYADPDGMINPRLDPNFPAGSNPLTRKRELDQFAKRYPEKAKAYAPYIEGLVVSEAVEDKTQKLFNGLVEKISEAKLVNGVYTEIHIDSSGNLLITPDISDQSLHYTSEQNNHSMWENVDLIAQSGNQEIAEDVKKTGINTSTLIGKGRLVEDVDSKKLKLVVSDTRERSYARIRGQASSSNIEADIFKDIAETANTLGVDVKKRDEETQERQVKIEQVPRISNKVNIVEQETGQLTSVESGFVNAINYIDQKYIQDTETESIFTQNAILELDLLKGKAATHQIVAEAAKISEDELNQGHNVEIDGKIYEVSARHTLDSDNNSLSINIFIGNHNDDTDSFSNFEYALFYSYLKGLADNTNLENIDVNLSTSYKDDEGKIKIRSTKFNISDLFKKGGTSVITQSRLGKSIKSKLDQRTTKELGK